MMECFREKLFWSRATVTSLTQGSFCELDFLLMEIVSTDYDDVMDTKRALNGKHICFVLSSCRACRGNILELIDLLENREEVRCTVKR